MQIALKFACEYERHLNFVPAPVPVLYTEYDVNIYSGSENDHRCFNSQTGGPQLA